MRPAVTQVSNQSLPIESWNGSSYVAWTPTVSGFYNKVVPKGINNPLRRDHTRAPSPLEVRYGYLVRKPDDLICYSDGIPAYFSKGRCVWLESDLNTLDDSAVQSRLVNQRIKTLASAVESSTEFGSFLRQSNQTIDMIRDFSHGVRNGLQRILEGPKGLLKKHGPMRHWKKLPDKYLEYCYGWAPLAGDLVNAVQTVIDMSNAGYTYIMDLNHKTKVRLDDFDLGVRLNYGFYPGAFGAIPFRVSREIEIRTHYRFLVPEWFSSQNPRPLTPFSEFYENTPFSFVLDWILPVGPWIQALETSQYSPFFREGTETVSSRVFYDCPHGTFPTSNIYRGTIVITNDYFKGESFMMRRRVLTEFPSAVTYRPALIPFPGLKQASQGLSLLAQAFQRWR